MTLQEIAYRALEENYHLRIVRNWENMAENNYTLGNAGFFPSLNLRADQLWGIQNTEQRFFNGDLRTGDNARSTRQDAFIEIDWTVFDGFRMFANYDRLGLLLQQSNNDTKYFIEQTLADISLLYFQSIKEQQLLESAEKSLDISRFRLELEAQKRAVGTGNTLLYHQALIDFNTDSALVAEQQRIITDIQIQLNRIIRFDPYRETRAAEQFYELQGFEDFETMVRLSVENNQDIRRDQIQELIAEANFRAERAARFPQISVFGNYSYTNQTNEVGFVESSMQRGGQYGVRVRFNLYDGGRLNTRLKNVKLEQENTALSTQQTKELMASHIASLMNRYESYRLQYALLEESLNASQHSLAIVGEQLQAGAISGFEFRMAQLSALNVENQLNRTLFNMKAIEIDLYRLTGQLTARVL